MKSSGFKTRTKSLARKPFKRTGKKVKKVKKPTITKLKKKLWELCKQLTRLIHGNVCYTCNYAPLEGSNWHTGHFIPDSTSSVEVRYHLDNLRPQCRNCNFWKSGDWPKYEAHLIKDNGEEYVKRLKELNRTTTGLSYREDWYEAKIAEYTALLENMNHDQRRTL